MSNKTEFRSRIFPNRKRIGLLGDIAMENAEYWKDHFTPGTTQATIMPQFVSDPPGIKRIKSDDGSTTIQYTPDELRDRWTDDLIIKTLVPADVFFFAKCAEIAKYQIESIQVYALRDMDETIEHRVYGYQDWNDMLAEFEYTGEPVYRQVGTCVVKVTFKPDAVDTYLKKNQPPHSVFAVSRFVRPEENEHD